MSPNKEDDGYFIGADDEDIDDSDDLENSPQVLNK